METEKYIHITDDYYLSTDKYNFIISKKLTCTDKAGNPIMRNEAYCGSLESLYKILSERYIKEYSDLLLNIDAAAKKIEEMRDGLMKAATAEIKRLHKYNSEDDTEIEEVE